MIGWHHQFNRHEFEQSLGVGDGQGDSGGQGSLACCSPWGRKELDTTERLNDNNKLSPEVIPFIRTMPIHSGESQDSAESSDISLPFAPERLRE